MKLIRYFIIVFLALISFSSVYSVLTTNNQVYYKFDGNLIDATGTTTTTNTGTTDTTGKINNSRGFSGSGQYIIASNFPTTTGSKTFSMWVFIDAVTGYDYIFDSNAGGSDRFILAVNSATGNYEHYDGTAWRNTGVSYSTGTWEYVTFVLESGTNLKFYKNGVNLFNTSVSNSVLGSSNSLGSDTSGGGSYFDGKIDEFSMWSRALSSTEVTELYNNGNGLQYPYLTATTPTINHNITTYYTTENITISLNTSSNVNMSYVLDSGSETSICNDCNSTTLNLYNLSEQLHNIILIANDENGETNTSVNFTTDYTAPTISVIGPISQDFEVDFSTVFNVTDALSGLASCYINATYLENVANASQYNKYANCTDTVIFDAAGLYNGYLIATDNAGNIETLSINGTIETLVYINFKDSLGSAITNYDATIYHPSGTIEYLTGTSNPVNISPYYLGELDLGTYNITFSKLGYLIQTISITINETSGGEEYNFTMSDARIVLYVRDKETGSIITGDNFSVEFVATVGASTSTTTGLVNITNTLFLNEQYLVVISNSNYQTETLTFNFNNQEELILNAYMIDVNNTNLGVVFIEPVSTFGQNLQGAIVRALQWDSSTSSYVQVSQAVTGSDGLASLNIILNDKIYIFSATYEEVTANSTSEIIDTTENGKTITIVLSGTSAEYDYLFNNVISSVTESYNEETNISTLTFSWTDLDGLSQTVCLNSYRVIRNSETVLTENCTAGGSGIYILNFYVNSSYTTVLKGEFKLSNGAYVTIDSFRHFPANSLPTILEGLGLNIIVVPLLFLAAIAIGMMMNNVYIGTLLIFVFGGLSLYIAPTILTKGIVAFLGFISVMTIVWGVKPR